MAQFSCRKSRPNRKEQPQDAGKCSGTEPYTGKNHHFYRVVTIPLGGRGFGLSPVLHRRLYRLLHQLPEKFETCHGDPFENK